jgi:hypothetical protein
MRSRTLALIAPVAGALLLAGCGGKPKPAANSLDAMDSALINGAVTAEGNSLARAIKVDPAKLRGKQERPATTSLAALARKQAARAAATPAGEAPAPMDGVAPEIADGLTYANGWAKKLPADLPVMPGATLQEAAGRDGAPLTMRVASFTAPGDRSAVLAWYAQKARAAGYSATRGQKEDCLLLEGEKSGGAAYIIMVGATAGGRTPVDYIWTQG